MAQAKDPDLITAPDKKIWPPKWRRWIFTDHGFKDTALTNSILSDIRLMLFWMLMLQLFNAFK